MKIFLCAAGRFDEFVRSAAMAWNEVKESIAGIDPYMVAFCLETDNETAVAKI